LARGTAEAGCLGLFVYDQLGKTVAGVAGNLAQIIVYQYKTLISSETFHVLRNFSVSGAPPVFLPWLNTLILAREAQFSPPYTRTCFSTTPLNSSSIGY
jgi:hypothetical protein